MVRINRSIFILGLIRFVGISKSRTPLKSCLFGNIFSWNSIWKKKTRFIRNFQSQTHVTLLLQILFNVNLSSSYLTVRKISRFWATFFGDWKFLICTPLCQNPFWPRYGTKIWAKLGHLSTRSLVPNWPQIFSCYMISDTYYNISWSIRVISCCFLISTGAWIVTWREVCCFPIPI